MEKIRFLNEDGVFSLDGAENCRLEVLDGMPELVPCGVGDGAYDVNQNRRSDTFFSPFVGRENIHAFYSLIQLDGANELRIFNSIVLPIMGPAVSAMGIMGFIGNWNNYLLPMILISTPNKIMLPVMMATLNASTDINKNQGGDPSGRRPLRHPHPACICLLLEVHHQQRYRGRREGITAFSDTAHFLGDGQCFFMPVSVIMGESPDFTDARPAHRGGARRTGNAPGAQRTRPAHRERARRTGNAPGASPREYAQPKAGGRILAANRRSSYHHYKERLIMTQKWTRAMFQPNLPLSPDGYVTASPAHIALSRQAAQEGMVLLKNEGGALPLRPGCRVALFGKGSFDYVKGGGGSGDVTVAYTRNVYEGLQKEQVPLYEPLSDFYRRYVAERYAAGDQPGLMAEARLPAELVAAAREASDVAVVVLSRFSGEGWDRSDNEYVNKDEPNPWEHELTMPRLAARIFGKSDFYRTEAERALIEQVCAAFGQVVLVLNVGGVVDVSWFCGDARIPAVLLAYQAGMEGGSAVAALLTGRANPCGRLPDTFAQDLDDYPSTGGFFDSPHYVAYTEDIYVGYRYFETLPGAGKKVLYPFGFGLSYTEFAVEPLTAGEKDGQICVCARVTNTGSRAGKEVVQLYYGAPQGVLQKPARSLAAFQKTRLLAPGESEVLALCFAAADMASFDDLGKIRRSAWVLEQGRYALYLGASVRDAKELGYAYEQAETAVVRTVSDSLAPSNLEKRLLADGSCEALPAREPVDSNADGLERLPAGTEEAVIPAVRGRERFFMGKPYAEGAVPFTAVAEGRLTVREFLAQLSDADLIHLLGGQPNTSVSNTFGMGNLPEYGVPDITTADGPAGLRLIPQCGVCTTAWPCATLLAATWDAGLTARVGAAAAAEVKENNIAVWLAPAVNLHRSPLCGRNFEYWSEDPLLTGKLAASMVKGIQSQHIAATVKHFACNNKETNRKHSDSRVSQRALREIYLRAFEIIVREAQPWAIMSSYNIINGRRASESRELLTDILRGDWGYTGMVMTDWWNRAEHYKEILAGNDLKMASGYPERVQAALERGLITRADLEACAGRVLELILKID